MVLKHYINLAEVPPRRYLCQSGTRFCDCPCPAVFGLSCCPCPVVFSFSGYPTHMHLGFLYPTKPFFSFHVKRAQLSNLRDKPLIPTYSRGGGQCNNYISFISFISPRNILCRFMHLSCYILHLRIHVHCLHLHTILK